jgi:nucleoside-diphosphate-sugar epimerase
MSNSQKILITGGTGFIGYYLIERLIKENTVKCLVRKNSNIKFLDNLGVELAYGDLKDIKSLKNAVKDIDSLFHLAAAFGKHLPRHVYFDVNAKGTKNLLSVCEEVERIIHCSAVGVYGPIQNPPANENFPYNPSNPYEESKCEGEKIAINYINKGYPITIIQPAVVYGPRDISNIFKLFKAIKNQRFRIIGNGENLVHLVYVENLIDGLVLSLKEKKSIGEKYIIADETAVTFLELSQTIADTENVNLPKIKIPVSAAKISAYFFETIRKIMEFDPPLTKDRVNFLTENHAYDISKAKKELGFMPKVSLEEGVKRSVEWYKTNGFL